MPRNGVATSDRKLHLNLGCGTHPLPGFVNIDVLPGPGVDLVADLSEALPFEDGGVDLIYASHLLEHFPTAAIPWLLRDWRRVLCDGGTFLVAVPDLEVIADCLLERRGWFTPPHNPWLGAIYGGQTDEYDFHKTGFTLPWLAGLLTEAGFGSIQRVDWFREVGAPDFSRSELPFGRNVSLNVRASAGGSPLRETLLQQSAPERALELVDRGLVLLLRTSVKGRTTLMNRRRRRIEAEVGAASRE